MTEPTPEHKFKGNLSVLDVVMITASGVTPASSIFVIAPLAIASAGSGAFISFLIATFIAATIALCYAELGAAHPSAGGEYSIIKRLFGTLCGLQTYLFILSAALFVPAVLATGAVPYLNTALGTQFDASTAGMITILIGGACAIFNIKANALAPIAATRMTEDILPPEVFKKLTPEYVAPVVGFLCSEEVPDSASIFIVGGGKVQRAALFQNAGVTFDAVPSYDEVAAQWSTIDDMSAAKPASFKL